MISIRGARHLALALVVLTGATGTAWAQMSPGTEAGTIITVDVHRGRFENPLPFDVQFYVQGAIDGDVTSVTGRMVERGRKETCPAAFGAQGRTVTAFGPATFLTPATGRRFEVSIPALAPNRAFCFELTLTMKADVAALRKVIAEQLDLQLQNVYGREESLAAQTGYEGFRSAVIAAIDDIRRRMEVEKGMPLTLRWKDRSFFDASVNAQGINLQERTRFSQLFQAQANKANDINTFRQSATAAAGALTALAQSRALKSMAAQLRTNASQPLVQLRLGGDTSALQVADLTDPAIVAMASGIPAAQLTSAANVDQAWSAGALNGRIATLDTSIRQLEAVERLALELRDNAALRNAAGLADKTGTDVANPQSVSSVDLSGVADNARNARELLAEARGALADVQDLLAERLRAIDEATAQIAADLLDVIVLEGNTVADWETRAKSHVSADVGVAWSEPIESFFFYLGANFYFGPVNRKAPLRWTEPGNFRKRVAVLAGIPLNPFDTSPGAQQQFQNANVQLDGVLGDRPLLLGGGIRLNDLLRVTAGTVLFRVADPNPLIDNTHVDYSWFVSFSIDWDLRGMFSGLATPAAPAKSVRRKE